MARTAIAVQSLGINGAKLEEILWTAGDQANGMEFVNDGYSVLLIKNADASSKTVTVVSVDDPYGRSEDIPIAVAAGKEGSSGILPKHLFNQSGGLVNLNLSADTNLTLAVLSYKR